MPESIEQAFPDLPHVQLADVLPAGQPPGQSLEAPLPREPIAAASRGNLGHLHGCR